MDISKHIKNIILHMGHTCLNRLNLSKTYHSLSRWNILTYAHVCACVQLCCINPTRYNVAYAISFRPTLEEKYLVQHSMSHVTPCLL